MASFRYRERQEMVELSHSVEDSGSNGVGLPDSARSGLCFLAERSVMRKSN